MSASRVWLRRVVPAGLLAAVLVAGCGSTRQAPPMSTGTSAATASASSSPVAGAPVTEPPTSISAVTPTSAPPTVTAETPVAPVAPVPVSPGGLVTDADMSHAAAAVAAMSVPEQAGSVIMVSSADAVGTDAVRRLHLGGVILMGSRGSIDGTAGGTPSQVAAVTAELQAQVSPSEAGLLVATDQESGLVTRLVNGFTDFPGAAELSSISDPGAAVSATQSVTAAAGKELLAVGINVNFAPDADVLPKSGPSGVDGRSFGSNPVSAGKLVAAAVRGYQSVGVAATIKHFPGIGRLATDTHKALPTLDVSCDDWNSVEAVPMRAGVDAGAALVMTGHVLMPAVGATGRSSALSSEVVTDLLRGAGRDGCEGLNFRGVTVSDSFEMAPVVNNYGPAKAASLGVAAGQDLVLMPADPAAAVTGIVDAVAAGSLPAARLQAAATNVYALRLALARTSRPGLEVVDSAAHAAVAAQARSQG